MAMAWHSVARAMLSIAKRRPATAGHSWHSMAKAWHSVAMAWRKDTKGGWSAASVANVPPGTAACCRRGPRAGGDSLGPAGWAWDGGVPPALAGSVWQCHCYA